MDIVLLKVWQSACNHYPLYFSLPLEMSLEPVWSSTAPNPHFPLFLGKHFLRRHFVSSTDARFPPAPVLLSFLKVRYSLCSGAHLLNFTRYRFPWTRNRHHDIYGGSGVC